MSPNGRLLRKLRKFMSVGVASSSLVACSSQISYGQSWTVGSYVFDFDIRTKELTITTLCGVIAPFPKKENFPKEFIKKELYNKVGFVLVGKEVVGFDRSVFDGWSSLKSIRFLDYNDKRCLVKAVEYRFHEKSGCLNVSFVDDMKDDLERNYVEYGLTPWNFKFFLEESGIKQEDIRSIIFHGDISEIKAFCCALNVESVEIPESVQIIGKQAFWKYRNLRTIKLPKNLAEIVSGAFKDSGLEYIEIPNSVKEIGDFAFLRTPLKYIKILSGSNNEELLEKNKKLLEMVSKAMGEKVENVRFNKLSIDDLGITYEVLRGKA